MTKFKFKSCHNKFIKLFGYITFWQYIFYSYWSLASQCWHCCL